MGKFHQRIVREILERYRKDPKVIGIRLLGSVGRNEERPSSDVDIEVILGKGNLWKWQKKKKYGIHIDFVTSSRDHLLYQFDRYPYLCYIDLDKKVLYDPTGFLKEIKEKVKNYMKKHPKILEFWNKQFKNMEDKKAKGQQQNLIKLFDEAERLFSKEHKITRDWFRED